MSTKVTITSGDKHHVYHDAFDEEHVFMEISTRDGFDLVLNEGGERVTVRVNKYVARAMGIVDQTQFDEIELKLKLTGEQKFYRCSGRDGCADTFPSSSCPACTAVVTIHGKARDCIDVAGATLGTHLKNLETGYGTVGIGELEDCLHVYMVKPGSISVPRFWMGWAVFIHSCVSPIIEIG